MVMFGRNQVSGTNPIQSISPAPQAREQLIPKTAIKKWSRFGTFFFIIISSTLGWSAILAFLYLIVTSL